MLDAGNFGTTPERQRRRCAIVEDKPCLAWPRACTWQGQLRKELTMISRHTLTHSVLVALVALSYGIPAHAAKKARADEYPVSTKDVLTKIHATNQKEIEAGKLGESHAKNKDVIAYAKTLIKDHTAADEKVMAFAKAQNIDLGTTASGVTAMNKKDLAHLTDIATGDQFDNHFVQMMIEDHKKTIDELNKAKAATGDEQLKDLIDQLLPTLKDHQDKAQKLMDKARL
jgi:putative membrane protein